MKVPSLFLIILLSFVTSRTFCEVVDFVMSKGVEKIMAGVSGVVNFVFRTEELETRIEKDVTFNLYTKRHPDGPVVLYPNQRSILYQSGFNSTLPTIFIIHGYTDHKDRDVIVALRKVENLDCNVIVVDWRRLASLIYFNAASSTFPVGKYVANLITFLEDEGIDLSTVHLIGHSLGAQISSVVGHQLDGKIGRITGLDPAGPLFEFIQIRNSSLSLDQTDARFVDVIHTAAGEFGVIQPVGHADFYPNDGVIPQPGCENPITTISCSHIRAVEFYSESVARGQLGFLSKPCKRFGKGLENCTNIGLVPMGYYTPLGTTGLFYLQTNPKSPFAMGGKFYADKHHYIK